ncbi:MAG: DUF4230 domain-containing protein [Caldilineaceae bacterium]
MEQGSNSRSTETKSGNVWGLPLAMWVLIAALLLTLMLTPVVMRALEMGMSWITSADTPTAEAAAPVDWPTPPATYAAETPPAEPPSLVATPRPLPTPTPIPLPAWEEMSYLTTVKFTDSVVVQAERTTALPWQLGNMVTDRLLLKAVGQVQIGVNLKQISNIEVQGDSISLVLPKPEVTSVELLPDQSQIYDSAQVMFLSQYAGLEKEALEQSRQLLKENVVANESMMDMAQKMARLQLADFLRQTGFNTVEITFR